MSNSILVHLKRDNLPAAIDDASTSNSKATPTSPMVCLYRQLCFDCCHVIYIMTDRLKQSIFKCFSGRCGRILGEDEDRT